MTSPLAKICGVNSRAAMDAARQGGAAFVGLVFYPPSPRAVTPGQAAEIAGGEPALTRTVGLFVDAGDDEIATAVARAPLDLLQLHGSETPDRVAAIRERFGLPVMKAVKVAEAGDLAAADSYGEVADWLLFDAKPPKELKDALPGGNAVSFDWSLLAGRDWPVPWMLSGGLDAGNVAEAVRLSGARAVDVSSGVERAPGDKDPARIRAFLDAVRGLAAE